MANIERITCTWTGIQGPTGYTNFYAAPGGGLQPYVKTFWAALVTYLPTGVTVATPNNGQVLDEATGKMNGTWTNGTSGTTVGTSSTSYAPQAGALIKWQTTVFLNGRKFGGRTFLVPLAGGAYTSGGQLVTTAQSAILNAANALWQSGGTAMRVWHRPRYSNASPPVLLEPGSSYAITSVSVPFKICTLNSRRDT